jgi:hypothetical protein
MTASLVLRAAPAQEEGAPAAELLDASGLTATLPERLIADTAGQPFEPVQLDAHAELIPQLAWLIRREPIGGAEALIRENTNQVREQSLAQLHRALSSAATPTRQSLQDISVELRARRELLETRFHQVDSVYATTQERLHRWQAQIGQRSGSLGGELWRWIVGGQARLSLPEAVALWNDREHQALERAACSAAAELAAWLLTTNTDLLGRLEQVLGEARALHAERVQRYERLRQPSPVYAPWSLRIDPRVAGDALLARIDLDALLAELLRRQTAAAEGVSLEAHIHTLAAQEAERRLAEVGIAELIELELGASGAEADEDMLVLAGQTLLEQLERPTWRLGRGARPRVETVQVTPDGAPLYSLDGLSSAAYDDTRDRMGFVRVTLGVATDDLALLRDGDEAFQTALQQRNLFVLDELALAWERDHGSIDPAVSVPDQTQPTNGRVGVPAVS